jgi:selenocysteine lyase/cysteine desulfurase
MTDRRDFIRNSVIGAGGATVLSALGLARDAFAADLSERPLSTLTGKGFDALRQDYLLADGISYLNHASIGTMPRIVHQARVDYMRLCETNPHLYMWGGAWEETREEVRAKAAQMFGARPKEIAITHNTTEAFNILAHGLPLGFGDEVLFSSLNHGGAANPLHDASRDKGYVVRRFQFPLDDVPSMSPVDVVAAYEKHITPKTRLLIFPAVDNVVGIRYPVRMMVEMARSKGVEWIAVDGAQSVGMIPVDVSTMDVDLYATSPHKWLQAPKGLGLVYVREALHQTLAPMWVRSGGNRWRESARKYEDYGTRNFPETISLGDAIDFQMQFNVEERQARLRELRAHTMRRAAEHPKAGWNSPAEWDLSSSLYNVALNGVDPNRLATSAFEEHGVVFRPFRTQGINGARLSPNAFTTEDEIDKFFDLI